MMLRNSVIFISVAVCLVALALATARRRELVSLREQEQQLRTQTTEVIPSAPQITSSDATVTTPEQHTPSVELLRLRGEVGQLERRKRELAGARTENEQLRVRLASKGTNAPGGIALPAGYLRKAEAKFTGYNTPEDTIQSLLWAIQNRDAAHFVEAFNPEFARQIEAEIQRRGSPEEFFKEADAMPGLRIVGKEAGTVETTMLTVEMIPGDETQTRTLRFTQIAGKWKLDSGF